MVTNKTLLLIFVTLASVTAQTFQYSRGWTNGKRDGHRRDESRDVPRDMSRDAPARHMSANEIAKDISASLEKIISPCQMNKLKYVLEGKSLYNELLYIPCDDQDDDVDGPKRYKAEKNQEPLFDAFQ